MVEQDRHNVKLEIFSQRVDRHPTIGSIHGATFLPFKAYRPYEVTIYGTRVSVVSNEMPVWKREVLTGPFYEKRVKFATWLAEQIARRRNKTA